MVVALTYAVAVNFAPSYRDTVDKVGSSTVGLQNTGNGDDEEASGAVEVESTIKGGRSEKEIFD